MFQQGLASPIVLGSEEEIQQIVQVALNPFAKHEAMVPWKFVLRQNKFSSPTGKGKGVKESRSKSPRRTEPNEVEAIRRQNEVVFGFFMPIRCTKLSEFFSYHA